MEYPGSYLIKPYRRIFFGLFLMMFLVISPLIIMYALGYRYDIKNGLLRETGAISIDIEPKNTNTYLNDLKIDDIMPVRLKNITPNKYHLRLSADGYYDFEKDIEVKNMQTVYIKEISLLKKSEPIQIAEQQPEILALSPNGAHLVYAVKQKKYQIYLLNTADNQIKKISLETNSAPKIFWSDNSEYFFVTSGEAPFDTLTVFNTTNPEIPWNVKTNTGKITKAIWQKTSESEIIFGTDTEILTARPLGQKITPVTKNKFVDWYADGGKIWTIQFFPKEQKYYLIKDALGFLDKFMEIKTESGQASVLDYKILQTKNEVVLLQSKPGQILIATRAKQSLVNADRWLLSPYNDWWLFWTPWELTTYSAGEEPYLQTRSGEGLIDVWPLDEHNTLGLIWKSRVEALFPYYSVGHNLLNFNVDSAITDNNKKNIYFSGKIKNKNGIWKLNY